MNARRLLQAIALATLVVGAGCFGGGATDSSPTATWSPTPVGDGTPTPSPVTWIDGGYVTNVSDLVDAHVAGLLERGFVTRVSSGNATFRYAVARNRTAFRIEPLDDSTFAAWSNGSVAAVRLQGETGVTYDRVSPSAISTAELTQSSRLSALLTSAKYAVTNVTTCGGTRCFAIRANGSYVDSYENFTASGRLTRSGVVLRFRASYVRVGEERRQPIQYRFDVRKRGDVSITRPPWVAEALGDAAANASG